ncbi:hypothetical protein HYDPIDRAFT_22906 [Hydnomerulius pinastri MD-312]|nr:hypothetical protein HYDPIDRAFT_22906 [Hydnomerulius pinastri MD-312]
MAKSKTSRSRRKGASKNKATVLQTHYPDDIVIGPLVLSPPSSPTIEALSALIPDSDTIPASLIPEPDASHYGPKTLPEHQLSRVSAYLAEYHAGFVPPVFPFVPVLQLMADMCTAKRDWLTSHPGEPLPEEVEIDINLKFDAASARLEEVGKTIESLKPQMTDDGTGKKMSLFMQFADCTDKYSQVLDIPQFIYRVAKDDHLINHITLFVGEYVGGAGLSGGGTGIGP